VTGVQTCALPIYMVSSNSTTGAKAGVSEIQNAYFNRIQSANLKNPCLIGFGISNAETFRHACQYANGAIIGSAFVNALQFDTPLGKKVSDFISLLKSN